VCGSCNPAQSHPPFWYHQTSTQESGREHPSPAAQLPSLLAPPRAAAATRSQGAHVPHESSVRAGALRLSQRGKQGARKGGEQADPAQPPLFPPQPIPALHTPHLLQGRAPKAAG
jgi:hypothetical protein